MHFLYSDDGRGFFPSLMGSWIFWIIIILVVILIFVLVLRSNKSLQKTLHMEKFFNHDNDDSKSTATDTKDLKIDTIRESLIKEINDENRSLISVDTSDMNNGHVPNFDKNIGTDLDDNWDDKLLLLGPAGNVDKNIKDFYAISSKQEYVFKVVDDSPDGCNFKLELKDLTKANLLSDQVSQVKIYNQNRACVISMSISNKKITIESISPYFDDIILPLKDSTRLLVFTQKSNKIFVDTKQVAALRLYDRITYFYIKSPIIKELLYMPKTNEIV